MTKKCVARTTKGKACECPPVRGTDRCVLHSSAGAASRFGKLGGMRARQFDISQLTKFSPPKDAADMRKLLAAMVIEMREGKIESHLATKIAFVASVFLRSSEQEDIRFVKEELELLKKKVLGA